MNLSTHEIVAWKRRTVAPYEKRGKSAKAALKRKRKFAATHYELMRRIREQPNYEIY